MKKIALTQRIFKNESYFEIRETLDTNWGKLFDKFEFEPLILPIEFGFKKLKFDGLILTGGNDLSSISNDEIDEKRDVFEKSLLEYCIKNQIPVLGICRGMQVINEYFGGNLKKVKNHTAVKHILDNGKEVNSYHNYAIDNLGEGLKTIAHSEDGVVEIIQHEKHKIYAQMSHPERNAPFDEAEMDLIRSYFND